MKLANNSPSTGGGWGRLFLLTYQFLSKHFFKCLFKISFDIFYMFNAHANTNLVWLHACSYLFCFVQLFVCCRSRMNHQRFCITDICKMTCQFQYASKTILQIFFCKFMIWTALQSGVLYEIHLWMFFEPLRQLKCILNVTLYAEC